MSAFEPPKKRRGVRLLIGGIIFAVLALINLAIFTGKLHMERVISGSMEPTLQIGDTVVVDSGGLLERYAVVVFDDPQEAGGKLVKRVMGMPGDVIRISGGILYINGKEEYSEKIPANQSESNDMRVRVPNDKIFVMGDNRNNSEDSRVYGPVPISTVMGVAEGIVWPPSRWHTPLTIH